MLSAAKIIPATKLLVTEAPSTKAEIGTIIRIIFGLSNLMVQKSWEEIKKTHENLQNCLKFFYFRGTILKNKNFDFFRLKF